MACSGKLSFGTLSLRLSVKPKGEGGPPQWWMRSNFEFAISILEITPTKNTKLHGGHLIRQITA